MRSRRFVWLAVFWQLVAFLGGSGASSGMAAEPSGLRIATFNVDATPPIGSPVAYAPTRKIEDPLFARGIVVLTDSQPIVLCAIDWIGIGNDAHTYFREQLAQAAGTTPDRVAVHALHQHDGIRADFRAEELMAQVGYAGKRFDVPFIRDVIARTGKAIQAAIPNAQLISHIGVGKANVEKVASNRRILGPDGKVKIVRYSSTKTNPAAREEPEGLVDPELKLISFWNGDKPVASLTYYATHPQSYYGKGDVTSEFVGLARAEREKAVPGVAHIHFNGASGNITAGKYNDGSHQARIELTERMADGMKRAWDATVKTPVKASDVSWKSVIVRLPVATHLTADDLKQRVKETPVTANLVFASDLAFFERSENGEVPIDLSCLNVGPVSILHMPGELFIEYQLAAQKMRPDQTVCMAAYGDYAPGYIGTEIAYSQGGYETSKTASHVAPSVEKVLMEGMAELLKK